MLRFAVVILAEKNAVFVTGVDENQIVWTIVNFDPERFAIEYLGIDPNFQQPWISVRCRELRVSVTYVTTALSDAGLESLRYYDVAFYQAMGRTSARGR